MPPIFATAEMQLGSWDEEKKGFKALIYTGATVLRARFTWEGIEHYELVLDMSPKSIRRDFLNSGRCCFLKDHDWRTDAIMGVIEQGSVSLDAQGLKAFVLFSDRPELEGVRRDMKRGIGANLSPGVQIFKLVEEERPKGELRRFRATDWQPIELSRVTVGADLDAQALSADYLEGVAKLNLGPTECTVEFLSSSTSTSTMTLKPKLKPDGTPDPAAALAAGDGNGGSPPAAPDDAALKAAREEGRKQQAEFEATARKVCAGLSLTASQTEQVLKDAGGDLAKARELAINLHAEANKGPETHSQIRMTDSEHRTILQGVQSAILNRLDHTHQLDDNARRFRGMTLLEIGKRLLALRNVPTEGLSKLEVAKLAFMTSDDLPNVFDNVARKRLLAAYQAEPKTFEPWCSRSDRPDFKPMKAVRISEAPSLQKVGKGGEVKSGTFSDSAESWGIEENAILLHFTREMLINDDLSALNRGLQMVGGACARLELDGVYDLLKSNPVMGSDGVQLFHASHGNTGSDALDEAGLNAAWIAMNTQKGIGGLQTLGLLPKFLLVPPALRVTAKKLVASITPAKTADVNPFDNELQVIVEPRLQSAPGIWYLAASPMQVQGIEYGFLEGENPPIVETFQSATHLGVSIRVIESFGTAAVDWRGLQKRGS